MKSIFLLLLIIIGFTSCVDQQSSNIRFTIYNQTDKQVTVSGFSANLLPNSKGIADPIIIAPQSSFTEVRVTGINDTVHMSYYSLHDGGVDSVRIVFEDNNLLVYTQKNLPDDKTGTILFGGDIGERHLGHYITEEDYALAVDCGEECF